MCKQSRTSRSWSPAQWTSFSACIMVDGWWRNCCKDCSTVPGWYHNDAGPKCQSVAAVEDTITSHVYSLSLEEVEYSRIECIAWLTGNVPPIFWDLFQEHITHLDHAHKATIRLKGQRSLLKCMSHEGAIRVPKEVPASWVAWRDDDTGDVYTDPMNSVYTSVIKLCWPQCELATGPYIDETVGDHAETFLAYQWRMRRTRTAINPFILTFVRMFERLCFVSYVREHHTAQSCGMYRC